MSRLDVMYNSSIPPSEYLERKAVGTSGGLGSLYAALSDHITDQQTLPASHTKSPTEPYICRTFSGNPSHTPIGYLKWMDFCDAIKQSILFGMIEPSGVSSLINHTQPIDENTRFLYYAYRSKEEKLDLDPKKANKIISCLPSSTYATHMITNIVYGFEILCVIPLSEHQSPNVIDPLLHEIAKKLKNSGGDIILTNDERCQLGLCTNVTIYGSTTCIDRPTIKLLAVLDMLKYWQQHDNFHHPLKYSMYSLRCLCANNHVLEFFSQSDQTKVEIESIYSLIGNLNTGKNHLRGLFTKFPQNFSKPTLNEQLQTLQQQFAVFLSVDEEFRKTCRGILADVRRKRCRLTDISNLILEQRFSSLQTTETEQFSDHVDSCLRKAILLEKLHLDQIQYINVMDLCPQKKIPETQEHIDNILRHYLSEKNEWVFVLYSNDRLRDEKPGEWQKVYEEFLAKRENAAQRSTLVYADLNQCQCDLEHPTIVNISTQVSKRSRNDPQVLNETSQLNHSPLLQSPLEQPSSSLLNEINVLLLGETGVGKSTFINAFVNYLMFDTLQQAEQSKPAVLIPISFLLTTGDHFDEVTVKFGDVDANENHEHEGQSVTQHCKSYVFNLNNRLRLRLIDTPGIGDTRGIAQDDINIDHILTYVNNLSHLNAVCLLLKPNASRLNVFFRSCINQLFTYLTPISYNNIIFCFTNARSTFYAPGDTGPLLRQMLNKEYQNDIPFGKTNTFCFDSESFRYLAAKKYGVTFDDFQKQECENSWTTSVTESVRLLKYILTRDAYPLNEFQSPRKAALEISMLARPLMETLRLIVYNSILYEANMIKNRMILDSKPINSEMCSNCASSQIVQMGPFFLVQYQPTQLKTHIMQSHQCTSDATHFLKEYIVKYDFVAEPQKNTKERLRDLWNDILLKCNKLTHYLRQQRLSAQDDPFSHVLERFLNEEDQISQTHSTKNRRVRELLSSVKETRSKLSTQFNESNGKCSLNEIYQIINELKSFETVQKQMEGVKERRLQKMKACEYQIDTDFVKNNAFIQLIKPFH